MPPDAFADIGERTRLVGMFRHDPVKLARQQAWRIRKCVGLRLANVVGIMRAMSKQDVAHLIDELGSEAIQSALGVSHHAVRHARWEGAFPAAWFDQIDILCRERGLSCPRHAFKWRLPSQDGAAA